MAKEAREAISRLIGYNTIGLAHQKKPGNSCPVKWAQIKSQLGKRYGTVIEPQFFGY